MAMEIADYFSFVCVSKRGCLRDRECVAKEACIHMAALLGKGYLLVAGVPESTRLYPYR